MPSYKIYLEGLDTEAGKIKADNLKNFLKCFLSSERELLKNFIGSKNISKKTLQELSNFTITGLEKGSVILNVCAPEFCEFLPPDSYPDFYSPDLWNEKIDPDSNVISLLSKCLESKDDKRAMKVITKNFKPLIDDGQIKNIRIVNKKNQSESFMINSDELSKLKKEEEKLPDPVKSILTGEINMIEKVTGDKKDIKGKFKLNISNGKTILGIINQKFINLESLSKFWGKKVNVEGFIHFKTNKNLHYIEAKKINLFVEGAFEFIKINTSQIEMLPLIKKNPNKEKLKNIFGKWTGDESVEELLSILK